MICPVCGKKATSDGGVSMTLVGYSSPPGHNHDDNCRKRRYVCGEGHVTVVSRQNRCDAEGCDWMGKTECFCHPGQKVTEWPT